MRKFIFIVLTFVCSPAFSVETFAQKPSEKANAVGAAQVERQTASVKVNFICGKSSRASKNGTLISYKILLSKSGSKRLIDNLVYDDASMLTEAFERASKIK